MIRTGQIPLNPNVSLDYYRESYPWLYEAAEAARGAQIQIEHEANLWRKNESAAAYFDRHISEYLGGTLTVWEFAAGMQQAEQ